MLPAQTKLALWVGPKHSGKTTLAAQLVDAVRARGFTVAGFLAPAVRHSGQLDGFDLVDVATDRRAILARRDLDGAERAGRFGLLNEGLAFGADVLTRAVATPSDLVIVDEFGPLELQGRGWRRQVDQLVQAGPFLLVLVVRQEIVDTVAELYSAVAVSEVPASAPDAIDQVISFLPERS